MSIRDTLAALEADGKLTRYPPRRSRHPAKRRLFLTIEAVRDLTDRNSAVNLLVGRGFVEGSLMRWVSGQRIYGDHRGGRFLCRLAPPPPEIWEIRITEPVTQARLFGRFAAPDTLILTRFHTRRLLGNKGSPDWRRATAECENIWFRLFGSTHPFSGSSIEQYVTENCDDFPLDRK
jgi:hypothetical protein